MHRAHSAARVPIRACTTAAAWRLAASAAGGGRHRPAAAWRGLRADWLPFTCGLVFAAFSLLAENERPLVGRDVCKRLSWTGLTPSFTARWGLRSSLCRTCSAFCHTLPCLPRAALRSPLHAETARCRVLPFAGLRYLQPARTTRRTALPLTCRGLPFRCSMEEGWGPWVVSVLSVPTLPSCPFPLHPACNSALLPALLPLHSMLPDGLLRAGLLFSNLLLVAFVYTPL